MDTTPSFLPPKLHSLNLDLSGMGDTDTVKLKRINNLHEHVHMVIDDLRQTHRNGKCAECWTQWPCATHLIIHDEERDSCVHRI